MHRFPTAIALCLLITLGLFLPLSFVAPAAATFLGDTVTCTPGFSLGSLTIEASAVVSDPAIEFTLAQPGTDLFHFDFSASTLTVTALELNSISGSSPFTFGNLNCDGVGSGIILGLTLEPGSMVLGPGSISFTDDSITVDLQGGWQAGDQATIQITTSCDPVAVTSTTWGHVKSEFVE